MAPIRLRRIEAGVYETRDGRFRVLQWDATAGNRRSWCVAQWDGTWDFVCEVLTLGDARRYLAGENVFILS
jgi:hypothetical protein